MLTPRLSAWLFIVGLMVLGTGVTSSQSYPNKPIRLVVAGAGGGNEFAARMIAAGISGPLGQRVIVDNREAVALGGELVSKAQPDGHTLFMTGSSIWVAPLFQKTPYDTMKDFAPISLVESKPAVLVLNPSVSANSVKELIALAKSRPGELNYASGSTGSSTHFSAELFKALAGVDIVRVNYKGAATSLAAVISGEVQAAFYSVGAVLPHVKSGRLKALAITSAEPSALFPGLPTVAASGVPGYESTTVAGMFAPAKTPVVIIDRVNQEIVRFLRLSDTKEVLLRRGSEPVGNSPQEFAAMIKSDIARLGKMMPLLKEAGIRPE